MKKILRRILFMMVSLNKNCGALYSEYEVLYQKKCTQQNKQISVVENPYVRLFNGQLKNQNLQMENVIIKEEVKRHQDTFNANPSLRNKAQLAKATQTLSKFIEHERQHNKAAKNLQRTQAFLNQMFNPKTNEHQPN